MPTNGVVSAAWMSAVSSSKAMSEALAVRRSVNPSSIRQKPPIAEQRGRVRRRRRPTASTVNKYGRAEVKISGGIAVISGTVLQVPTFAPSRMAMLCARDRTPLPTRATDRSETAVLPCRSTAAHMPRAKPRQGESVRQASTARRR